MFRRLIGLSVVTLLVGCGGDNHTPTSPSTDGPNTPYSHTTPVSGATATWSTSDTAVATVTTDGVVTSVGKGIAVIRASAPGEVIWFHPNPNSRPPFQRLSLGSGETFQIPISVIPTPTPLPLVVVAASKMTSTAGSWSSISSNPASVFGGLGMSSVTSCGVNTDGDGYCWGDNSRGQLGDSVFSSATIFNCSSGSPYFPFCNRFESHLHVPLLVSGGHTWSSISASTTSCGVTTDGDGYCWGDGSSGQLGTGGYFGPWVSPDIESPVPVLVKGGHTWASISTQGFTTCGVTTDGDGYCWGDNQQGGLGSGSPSERIGVPVRVITPWVE